MGTRTHLFFLNLENWPAPPDEPASVLRLHAPALSRSGRRSGGRAAATLPPRWDVDTWIQRVTYVLARGPTARALQFRSPCRLSPTHELIETKPSSCLELNGGDRTGSAPVTLALVSVCRAGPAAAKRVA